MEDMKRKLDGDKLDLSMSQLKEVPVTQIATVPKATHLDLSYNSLTRLEPVFCLQLYYIVKLDLSHNVIDNLPWNIGEMHVLQFLDVANNRITVLPLSFSNLHSLRWLDVKNNPLDPKLRSVAGDCISGPDCQKAARKVVYFMQYLQESWDQERNKEQKALEAVMQQSTETVTAKRKKKKKKKKSTTMVSTDADSDPGESASIVSDIRDDSEEKSVDYVNEINRKAYMESKRSSFRLAALIPLLMTLLTVGLGVFAWLLVYTGGSVTAKDLQHAIPLAVRDVKLLADLAWRRSVSLYDWCFGPYVTTVASDIREISFHAAGHIREMLSRLLRLATA